MSTDVVIVPTGTANIASVNAAFRRLDAEPKPAESPDDVGDADYLVLPGVGAFGAAMGRIDEQGFRESLVDRIEEGRPTLAICLGMQLLGEKSDESPQVSGLGAVPERVTRFPQNLTVPQLGWNRVTPDSTSRFLESGWAYFANSYKFETVPDGWIGARTEYGGEFASAIERGNVLACQFHPELSGAWGADLLRRWLDGTGSRS
ncbi:MAG: imidazole glycerol phosphate synthase subunit HisH [Actinomycetia bacterium]|nr:imidazole glycerol phosphate synthase subunit HisH [Actinomycetes bacterium]